MWNHRCGKLFYLSISSIILITSCGDTNQTRSEPYFDPKAALNQQIILSEDVSRFVNSDMNVNTNALGGQSSIDNSTNIPAEFRAKVNEIKIAAISNYPWISQQAVWLGNWSQVVHEGFEKSESPVKIITMTFAYNKKDGGVGWVAKAVVNMSSMKVNDYKINSNILDAYRQPVVLSAYDSGALVMHRTIVKKNLDLNNIMLKDVESGKSIDVDLRGTLK